MAWKCDKFVITILLKGVDFALSPVQLSRNKIKGYSKQQVIVRFIYFAVKRWWKDVAAHFHTFAFWSDWIKVLLKQELNILLRMSELPQLLLKIRTLILINCNALFCMRLNTVGKTLTSNFLSFNQINLYIQWHLDFFLDFFSIFGKVSTTQNGWSNTADFA